MVSRRGRRSGHRRGGPACSWSATPTPRSAAPGLRRRTLARRHDRVRSSLQGLPDERLQPHRFRDFRRACGHGRSAALEERPRAAGDAFDSRSRSTLDPRGEARSRWTVEQGGAVLVPDSLAVGPPRGALKGLPGSTRFDDVGAARRLSRRSSGSASRRCPRRRPGPVPGAARGQAQRLPGRGHRRSATASLICWRDQDSYTSGSGSGPCL